ncbi:MAG: EamA family transporter RarD [Notoacmeibacter sp.]
MSDSQTTQQSGDTREGFLYAGGAYLIWGFLPFYMKAVSHIPPYEVVAHRILWSVPIAGLIILWLGLAGDMGRVLRSPKMLAQSAICAALITINWGIYVWAIGNDRAIETALGYYINPLFSIFMAFVLLKEKLAPLQWAAIALAAAAVVLITWGAGGVPIVALGLTVTWGFYAFLKKTLPVGGTQGFFLEVLMLCVPALGFIAWLEFNGTGHFFSTGTFNTGMLAASGLVTAIPLILYANGAKLLKLSTIGIMQYSAPTLIFLTAIFVFNEPFDRIRGIAFLMIALALVLYSVSLFRGRKS